jgi:hypothetical protein
MVVPLRMFRPLDAGGDPARAGQRDVPTCTDKKD